MVARQSLVIWYLKWLLVHSSGCFHKGQWDIPTYWTTVPSLPRAKKCGEMGIFPRGGTMSAYAPTNPGSIKSFSYREVRTGALCRAPRLQVTEVNGEDPGRLAV